MMYFNIFSFINIFIYNIITTSEKINMGCDVFIAMYMVNGLSLDILAKHTSSSVMF